MRIQYTKILFFGIVLLYEYSTYAFELRPARGRKDSALGINLGWFSSGKNEDERRRSDEALSRDGKGIMNIMDSMEGFKKSQRVGKMTSSIVEELASTTVEGSAQDGKVKVIYDCQQRPVSVYFDEAYFDSADTLDFSNAITAAMKDAHAKSIEKMDEKMKTFYSDLGLPPTSSS